MTLRDVEAAAKAVAAAGTTPSGNTVLAYLKARGMRGCKRTVLRLMKQLPPVQPRGPVQPVSARPPPDPLAVWAQFAAYRRAHPEPVDPAPVWAQFAAAWRARHAGGIVKSEAGMGEGLFPGTGP